MNTINWQAARSPGGAVRRGTVAMLATSCMIISALALSAPAGAAKPFGPHDPGVSAHGTLTPAVERPHNVAPLTLANFVVTNLSSGDSYVYSTTDVTPAYPPGSANGCNQDPTSLCLIISGVEGFGMEVPAPGIAAGSVYDNLGSSMSVAAKGVPTCGGLRNSSVEGSVTASVEVDQYDLTSPNNLDAVAVQFDCTNDTVDVSGTIAYNIVPTNPSSGYYVFGQAGEITGFGNDNFLSYLDGAQYYNLNSPIVGMAPTPDGGGYWMVGGDGGVFSSGDAGFYGSTGNIHLNKPVVGMAAAPDGKGYWFVASDGGVFNYGSAGFYGSAGSLHLNKPIVGMAVTPSGHGYWLVASDGGIFAYGDAGFYGSTGNLHLNKPVVGMTVTPSGHGYWFVASDGGIFSYGDAGFYGSTGSIRLNSPIVSMASTPDGHGYWFVASDGGVFNYGSAPFDGSLGGTGVTDAAGISLGI